MLMFLKDHGRKCYQNEDGKVTFTGSHPHGIFEGSDGRYYEVVAASVTKREDVIFGYVYVADIREVSDVEVVDNNQEFMMKLLDKWDETR